MIQRASIALMCLLAACSTASRLKDADREVGDILDVGSAAVTQFREKDLVYPEAAAGDRAEAEPDLSGVPREVGLLESLAVATSRNRDYLSERESLYIAALALTGVRNEFSPFFAGTLSAILTDSEDTRHGQQNSADISVRQILPTGGTVSLSGSADADSGGKGGYTLGSGWTVNLTQPLLRDAGYETSHEALTQAERNVVYAVRDFELFREDFTIQVISRFYSLVRQIQEIQNAEADLESKEFLRRQSEEKFKVDLATEVDMLRARREYLRSKNSLLTIQEAYRLALDRFKILLGLPTSFPLEIRYEEPRYRDLEMELGLAVKAALHNRLDLLSTRDRLEDAEREVRIRTNGMLPDLDLTAGYTRTAPADPSFGRSSYKDGSYLLGLTLNLPLERTAERNALRRALIDLDRAKRSLTLAEDNVILDVRDSLRSLRRARTSLEIRKEEIKAAEKEARAAQIRFEAGEMDNRNVSEAQNAVLRAKNSYIQDLVDYEVSRIQLYRDIGILFVNEDGMWVEP